MESLAACHQSARHDPQIVFAHHDHASDDEPERFAELLGIPAKILLSRIEANEADFERAGVNLLSYVGPDEEHNVFSDGPLYTETVKGETLVGWVTRVIEGKPGRRRALPKLPRPLAVHALVGVGMGGQVAARTARSLAPALQDAEPDKPSYTRFLERLLAVETEATERRRLEGRLRFASFPSEKTLADIDYNAQPALDHRMVAELGTLRFVDKRGNLLLIAPPGLCKMMLAVAIGRRAVEAGYRVYNTTAPTWSRGRSGGARGPLADDQHGSIILTTNRSIAGGRDPRRPDRRRRHARPAARPRHRPHEQRSSYRMRRHQERIDARRAALQAAPAGK